MSQHPINADRVLVVQQAGLRESYARWQELLKLLTALTEQEDAADLQIKDLKTSILDAEREVEFGLLDTPLDDGGAKLLAKDREDRQKARLWRALRDAPGMAQLQKTLREAEADLMGVKRQLAAAQAEVRYLDRRLQVQASVFHFLAGE